jgi:hypothetical protein
MTESGEIVSITEGCGSNENQIYVHEDFRTLPYQLHHNKLIAMVKL